MLFNFLALKFNGIKLYYQNVRGLRTKTIEFYKNICSSSYDIIVLTETWLMDGILNGELFDHRYTVHRRDRTNSTKKDGGGLLIAIRKSLNSTRIMTWASISEDLWVTFEVKNKKSLENIHCVLFTCLLL